jgi:hypothetical protein
VGCDLAPLTIHIYRKSVDAFDTSEDRFKFLKLNVCLARNVYNDLNITDSQLYESRNIKLSSKEHQNPCKLRVECRSYTAGGTRVVRNRLNGTSSAPLHPHNMGKPGELYSWLINLTVKIGLLE